VWAANTLRECYPLVIRSSLGNTSSELASGLHEQKKGIPFWKKLRFSEKLYPFFEKDAVRVSQALWTRSLEQKTLDESVDTFDEK
jgi:hypothetical protein